MFSLGCCHDVLLSACYARLATDGCCGQLRVTLFTVHVHLVLTPLGKVVVGVIMPVKRLAQTPCT